MVSGIPMTAELFARIESQTIARQRVIVRLPTVNCGSTRCVDLADSQTSRDEAVGTEEKVVIKSASALLIFCLLIPQVSASSVQTSADCLAEMDYRTGQILDAIKESGIEETLW